MSNKNHLFKTEWVFVLIAVFLFLPTTLVAEISGVQLLSLLSEKDQISESVGYKTSFVMTTQNNQFNDPNQGIVFMDCKATWTVEGLFAMKITYNYEHPPVFAPPSSRGYKSYDYYDGNLIVWRTLKKYTLSAPERNDTLEKIRAFVVDPNGEILKTHDKMVLHRFLIDRPDNMYQFNQFRMAVGRGFSRHLGTVTSLKSLSSGGIKVTSEGSYGQGLNGSWELTLDPNSDYLVRKAIFTMDGADKPTIITTSSGVTMKDAIKVANRGVYKFVGVREVSVEVMEISKVVGQNKIYEEVLLHLDSPLPTGSLISDLRGEKPIRTIVK